MGWVVMLTPGGSWRKDPIRKACLAISRWSSSSLGTEGRVGGGFSNRSRTGRAMARAPESSVRPRCPARWAASRCSVRNIWAGMVCCHRCPAAWGQFGQVARPQVQGLQLSVAGMKRREWRRRRMWLRRPQEWVSGCEGPEGRAQPDDNCQREAKCSSAQRGTPRPRGEAAGARALHLSGSQARAVLGQEAGGVGLNRAGMVGGAGFPGLLGALGVLQAASDPPFDPCVPVPLTWGAALAVGSAGA